jgi:photosystem II stability/assembly factor-like uncharacterized protein
VLSTLIAATSLLAIPCNAQSVATQFGPTGIAGGGRLTSIAINPLNTSHIVAVSESETLYRTLDKGLNWTQVPHSAFIPVIQTNLKWVNSDTQQWLYATRRLGIGSSVTRPAYSIDSGLTWTDIPVPAAAADPNTFLRIDPGSQSSFGTQQTQRLILENHCQLWFSRNGGMTWELMFTYTPPVSLPNHSLRLAGVFWSGYTVLAATNIGIIYTDYATSSNPGWTLNPPLTGVPTGAQIVDFTGRGNRLYATFVSDSRSAVGSETFIEFDDGDWLFGQGQTAANFQHLGLYSATRASQIGAWESWGVTNGPVFTQVQAVGAYNQIWCATSSRSSTAPVYQSAVPGTPTWIARFQPNGSNSSVVTGYQGDGGIVPWTWGKPGLSFALIPSLVSAANDKVAIGGSHPYITENSGSQWTQLFVTPTSQNAAGTMITKPKAYRSTGLSTSVTNTMHWLTAEKPFIGSSDIGLQVSADAGRSWTLDYTPSSLDWPNWFGFAQKPGTTTLYAAVADRTTPTVFEPGNLADAAIASPGHSGQVLASSDEGQTWGPVAGSSPNPFPGPVVSVATDPNQPNHVYACSPAPHSATISNGGIYRSTDNGATWAKLSAHARTEGRAQSIQVLAPDVCLATFGARTVNGAYTESSGVFLKLDAAGAWQDRSATGMKRFTRDIAVAPAQAGEPYAQRWFAAAAGYDASSGPGDGGVYRTTDAGVNWTRIWTARTAKSVTWVPGVKPVLYVGTDADGLWFSANPLDASPTFSKLSLFPFESVGKVFTSGLREDCSIWVTTQGGGIWRGQAVSTMVATVIKTGANIDFQVDVLDSGGTAPQLWATTTLTADGSGWSSMPNPAPATSAITGGTRYLWSSVSTCSIFLNGSLSSGYLHAKRVNGSGMPEASDVGGWTDDAIAAGTEESVGVAWVKTPVYRGLATTVSGAIELASPLPSPFVTGKEYYVETTDGHRIELIENQGTTSTLIPDLTSLHTTTGGVLPAFHCDLVRVRPHWTLDEVFDRTELSSGGTSTNNADRVQLNTPNTTNFVSYWHLAFNGVDRWVLGGSTSTQSQGALAFPPDAFALVKSYGTMNRPLRTYGLVRDHVYRQPLPAGFRYASLGHPADSSPVSAQMMAADGFVASDNPTLADRVQRWSGDLTTGGNAWVQHYFLAANPKFWRRGGTTTILNENNVLLFGRGKGLLYNLKTARPNRVVQRPWQLN